MEGWEAPESQRGCARRLPGRRARPGRMLPQYSTRRSDGCASRRPAFRASAAGSGASCYPRVPDDAPPNARFASHRAGSVGWVRCRWCWRLGLEPLLGRPACAHAVAPALQRPLLQVAVAASLAAGRAGSASQDACPPFRCQPAASAVRGAAAHERYQHDRSVAREGIRALARARRATGVGASCLTRFWRALSCIGGWLRGVGAS